MTRIVTILTPGFADWETALLNAAARGFYKAETAFASPDSMPIISMGGMAVTPSMTIDAIAPEAFDALIICGGSAWKAPGAPDITAVARQFHNADKLIGAICDGTFALARTGLLDTIGHTSNGLGYLDETGYAGRALYRDTHAAVTEQRIVTAGGTSPVAFMSAVMRELGYDNKQLDYYAGLHAAQFGAVAAKAA